MLIITTYSFLRPIRFLFVSLLLLCTCTTLQADEVLNLSITQRGETNSLSFGSLTDLFDVAESNPGSLFENFDSTLASTATINYLGQNWMLGSTEYDSLAGNQDLSFLIPELGIDETFTGTGGNAEVARDNAYNQLEDFLKSNSKNLFRQIQQTAVAESPNSVIAGNPNSIQTKMVVSDFDVGFTQQTSQIERSIPAQQMTIPNLFGINATYGRFRQDGVDVSSWTLPLSYTILSDDNPQRKFTLSLPVSYGKVGSGQKFTRLLLVYLELSLFDPTGLLHRVLAMVS